MENITLNNLSKKLPVGPIADELWTEMIDLHIATDKLLLNK